MAKLPKYPRTVYGDWNTENGTDAENRFFQTDAYPHSFVEKGEKRRIGVYKLEGFIEVDNETSITPSKTRRGD